MNLEQLKANWRHHQLDQGGKLDLDSLTEVELRVLYALARTYLTTPQRGKFISATQLGVLPAENDELRKLRRHLFQVKAGSKLPDGGFTLPYYVPLEPEKLQPELLEFVRDVKTGML